MNTQTEPTLDMIIDAALKKLARTKCQCCNKKAIDDDFGEFINGKWWCWDHVDNIPIKRYPRK